MYLSACSISSRAENLASLHEQRGGAVGWCDVFTRVGARVGVNVSGVG